MNYDKLRAELILDEGVKVSVYTDSEGYSTIGVGHLIDRRKGGRLSDEIIEAILREDINKCVWGLDKEIPWWRDLTDDRQNVLLNMRFQLGLSGLLGFHQFLGALRVGNCELAEKYMLESLWAKQTPARAKRLADVIRGHT